MAGLFIPLDGRLTSQNVLSGPLNGGEVMPIVSPGNAALGNSYQVTTAVLATYVIQSGYINTIILSGASYNALSTDTRILFNKTIGSASAVSLLSAVSTPLPVLIRDIKGDASNNNITINFTGTADGLASPIVINQNYGGYWFNPLANGNWYLGSA
jgi:hypothetical protein